MEKDTDYDKLEVKRSKIQNAGAGVFATKPFVKGEIVGEYRGHFVEIDVNESFDDRKTDMKLKDGRFLRGTSVTSIINDCMLFADYSHEDMIDLINDRKLKKTKNTDYNVAAEPVASKVFIVAMRDIDIGEELYLEYGVNYWTRRLYFAGKFPFKPNKNNETNSITKCHEVKTQEEKRRKRQKQKNQVNQEQA